jgi:hypothetical protein
MNGNCKYGYSFSLKGQRKSAHHVSTPIIFLVLVLVKFENYLAKFRLKLACHKGVFRAVELENFIRLLDLSWQIVVS